MPLWGHDCPLPALAALACLSLEGDGLVCSWLVLFSTLFCVQAWWCLRAFRMVAIPQSGLLAQASSFRLPSGRSGLVLILSNAACASLPRPLASGVCRRLCCFSAGGVTIGHVICGFYLFHSPPRYVALCGSKACHRLSSESVSWCLESSLFFKTPFLGRSSIPTSFVSLFIFYIFSYLLSKTMGCFLSA